ncbi:MAG: hypothetical protein Q8R90_11920 [Bacteroidales bacterium]|nr:hypothetical protein [Bacteroidales bacterium]
MLNIKISTLEKYIGRYPWFSAGYQEVYDKICSIEGDDGGAYLSKAASHVWSRANLYRIQKVRQEASRLRLAASKPADVTTTPTLQSPVSQLPESQEVVRPSDSQPIVAQPSDLQPAVAEQSDSQQQEVQVAAQLTHSQDVVQPSDLLPSDSQPIVAQPSDSQPIVAQPSDLLPSESHITISSSLGDDILDLEDDDEIMFDEISDMVPDQMPKFVLAGGDYFSRRDFEKIELDRSQPLDNFIAEKPTLLRAAISGRAINPQPQGELEAAESFEDASFYTETLASIYIEQGFYKRALDVYAKLILLYPEKSAYFATLVKDIKNKI